jgi:predicted ATPase
VRRFIITGTPGAGKTAILRELELPGFSVVEEAATDIIAAAQASGEAEPWKKPAFIDSVVDLQKQRRICAAYQPDDLQFHDRSPVCTAALAVYLEYPFSAALKRELEEITKEWVYETRVFLFRISAILSRPKHVASLSLRLYVSSKFMNTYTVDTASNWFQSNPRRWLSESARSSH